MAETKCRTCGSVDGYHVFMCPSYGSPAPPAAPEAVLTRDLVVRMVNAAMFGWPDTNEPAKLLAHDAALRAVVDELAVQGSELRARVEELEKELDEAKAEASAMRRAAGMEKETLVQAVHDTKADLAVSEARSSRLMGLLRSESAFMRSFGYTMAADGLDERIRKALAGEE